MSNKFKILKKISGALLAGVICVTFCTGCKDKDKKKKTEETVASCVLAR